VVALLAGTACASQPVAKPIPSATATQSLAGRYIVSTGTGALAVATALTKAYSAAHPEVTFVFIDPGSVAISTQQVADGTADLAFSSRDLAPAEQHGLTQLPVGLSGTAVIVNPANPVTGLSKDQLQMIFSGTTRDWSAVGGAGGHIDVITREASKATRVTFDEYVFGSAPPPYANDAKLVSDIDTMLKTVRADPAAIGVATLDARTIGDPSVRVLAVDGVAATKDNLANRTYRMRRPLLLIYPEHARPAVRGFVDFVRSPDGQAITATF
jgi:phosphate transport system substrate-binding protein